MKKLSKFFTKRKVLLLANLIFFILLTVCCAITVELQFGWGSSVYDKERYVIVFSFIGNQCTFTVLSLIVYYLSIMAGALNKKYKEEVKDTEYEDKK